MANYFWQEKTLFEMSKEEWESICDGCAKCCLTQLEDEATQQLVFTDVACDLLDENSCRCTNYENRSKEVPNCMTMTVENVKECAQFAPLTCAYRLLLESKPLPESHHLLSGDRETIHLLGKSVKGKIRFERDVVGNELEEYVVDWP